MSKGSHMAAFTTEAAPLFGRRPLSGHYIVKLTVAPDGTLSSRVDNPFTLSDQAIAGKSMTWVPIQEEMFMSKPDVRLQDSIIAGLINSVINALIAYGHFKETDLVPLSVNSIANEQISVWGEAVSLTFGLGVILSLITAKLFIKQLHKTLPATRAKLNPPFWSAILPLAIKQSAVLFGWFVALAVIWTKYMGEVMVTSFMAAMLVGVFAFFITLFIEYRTKQSLIIKKISIFD